MNSYQNKSLRLLKTIPTSKNTCVVLGGGLSGLSAGFSLAKSQKPVIVLESDSEVGGLSRTVRHGEFRYDLGCEIMAGDINKDCITNLADLSMMASTWLKCNHMYQELCP